MAKKVLTIFGKTVACIFAVSFVLVFMLCLVIFALWHHEISSVLSIELLVEENKENKSAPVYIMDVSGDYYFDEFLERGGASDDDELIEFIMDNLTKGLIPMELSAPNIGCASFTCADAEGNRYFARGYDFKTTTAMIVRTEPKHGRYASVSSVDLQFLGIEKGKHLDDALKRLLCLAAPYVPLDGINEAGVSCGIYMSYQGKGNTNGSVATNQTTEKPDLTSTTLLRLILDYAGSVEEAIELARGYDLHDSANTSFHYMVADSTGKSAILEWVAATDHTDSDGTKRELRVYYNDDDTVLGEKEGANDFQYVTNFIVTPDYYSADKNKKGFDRYNEIERLINPDGNNSAGVITKEYAMEVLEAVGRRNWDAKNGKTDGNGITVWSILYDLTNKTATWVSNEEFDNPDAIFVFDFS